MDTTHLRAITCTICRVIKPIDAFHLNKSRKTGRAERCKACCKAVSAAFRTKHADKIASDKAKYQKENFEKIAVYKANWYQENIERLAPIQVEYRKANAEKIATNMQKYQRANPDKCNAVRAKRRASKLNASVPWANNDLIKELYSQASKLSKETGIPHQVDHIIPLQHELVCGLHWEGNLQILTKSENCKKSNKFTPGPQP